MTDVLTRVEATPVVRSFVSPYARARDARGPVSVAGVGRVDLTPD